MTESSKPSTPSKPSGKKQLVLYYAGSGLICLLLLAGAAGGIYWIYSSEPTAQREGATRKAPALVDTLVVDVGTYRPRLPVLGNVQPADEIRLSPLVGGEIVKVDPGFVPGGIVEKGRPLIEIDQADYVTAVTLRDSELKQVQAELKIEEGRQKVARKELEALGGEVTQENRALVLREPQIDSIRARADAAQAALDQAKLELKRTSLAAPFHAQIMQRTANLGTRVAPGESVARLVGVDSYWVFASVPIRHLNLLVFDDDNNNDDQATDATITMDSVWGPGQSRSGRVTRLIGELDPQARLAQVLITVDDPLALRTDGPVLLLDTIVQVNMTGKPIENVVRLPRDYLRQNNSVWVYDQGKLAIRPVRVVFGNAEHVYIAEGLNDGDEVVTTALATVVEGRPLRRTSDQATQNQADAPQDNNTQTGATD